jgi:outer membrane protein
MKRIVFILAIFAAHLAHAQDVKRWTLQECIDYAWNNNLQLRQNALQIDQANVNLLQSKAQALPSVSASGNHTYNTGRRIDPFTNQFADQRVLSQNFSVSSGVNLFAGLSNWNAIRAAGLSLKSAQLQQDQIKNDVALQVTNAFLSVLLAQELEKIAENQFDITQKQTERAKLLFENGQSAEGVYLQAQATLQNESLNKINARNNVERAMLSLALLLPLEDTRNFSIVQPNVSSLKQNIELADPLVIFDKAQQFQPGILSADFSIKSAEYSLKSAKGQYYPTLSAFGGLGTGYSELSRKVTGFETQQQNIGSIDGVPILLDVNVPTYVLTPFNEQLDQNFNRTVGFSLNIPLFSNLRIRNQVSLQKIGLENARINAQNQRNLLRRDIQTAWFDARAAAERFAATELSLNAAQKAFEYARLRFDEGLMSIYDFNAARNQLIVAESSKAQALYELVLRQKILDFYQGKPITF